MAGQEMIANKMIDLMPIIKKTDKFLDNYRLETVLEKYKIGNAYPHHALADSQATYKLASNLTKNGLFRI
ncbi:exonuclease domain-containing protein [Lactiplantibacillus carotarum]|uniref:exonuclease domain-containing protein n=1 Tax=Lactiplantibacillus carotarum TaxID=2993456 RepID=UPI00298F34EE|nr:exonuclease domain-containing protein [Lactiplantibacillus carotarum]